MKAKIRVRFLLFFVCHHSLFHFFPTFFFGCFVVSHLVQKEKWNKSNWTKKKNALHCCSCPLLHERRSCWCGKNGFKICLISWKTTKTTQQGFFFLTWFKKKKRTEGQKQFSKGKKCTALLLVSASPQTQVLCFCGFKICFIFWKKNTHTHTHFFFFSLKKNEKKKIFFWHLRSVCLNGFFFFQRIYCCFWLDKKKIQIFFFSKNVFSNFFFSKHLHFQLKNAF